jgi:hypothetical protein
MQSSLTSFLCNPEQEVNINCSTADSVMRTLSQDTQGTQYELNLKCQNVFNWSVICYEASMNPSYLFTLHIVPILFKNTSQPLLHIS